MLRLPDSISVPDLIDLIVYDLSVGPSRKLQGDIDRVLKKVQEGVDVFDSIWNKVYDADNSNNQKWKFIADFKKEIKKLQRYRDQINTLIQSIEIKDKKALMDARKLIERTMERFSICERETKTKPSFKEGLGQQPLTDPKEKAKSETRDWLNNVVAELEFQIDSFKAEMKGLSVKKGKLKLVRLAHLESSIARHKAHILKLELILRLLDNDKISPQQVDDVKDFIDDYVERNQEDFEEFEDVDQYASLPLDNVEVLEDLVIIGPPGLVKEDLVDPSFNPNDDLIVLQDLAHLKIPLQKLVMATNNFSKEYLIAKGGFGMVYKAHNEHGAIAVKKLDPRFGQGDREFMMEIAMLSAYTHKNLVSLVGFCNEGDEKILVYKHESNGSLDQHLHRKDLTWIQRLRICLDVAQGLKYLHNDIGTQHRILHRDMKSANILLDENLIAKISDFGLSKIAFANVPCTVVISKVCGTWGYCDPEYYKHGILTQKSDVYSFGVVMFEVLCGKLVGVSKHLGEPFSAELPKNCYEEGTLDDIIDSDLRKQMNSTSLSTFSAIAHQCLNCRGRDRPTMSVVVEELKKALVCQQVVSLE